MEITVRLLFMAAVTCYLLGRVFSGDASHPETVVYGMTAAFGLEFLIASWPSLWERSYGTRTRTLTYPEGALHSSPWTPGGQMR
jgi:hypothetical protein